MGVVRPWVGVNCPEAPTMTPSVSLAVTVQVEPVDKMRSLDRLLEDAG